MPMVDARGRLLRRFNLIDVAMVALTVLVIPAAFVAYRAFRVPAPVILTVTPATLSLDSPGELRVTGEHFRPFLRAYISKAGVPMAANDLPESQRARYLIQTTGVIELALPVDLKADVYDLYLFDEGREVARRLSAFTLTPRGIRPVASAPGGLTATLEIGVRFLVDPDLEPSIKIGDADINDPGAGAPAPLAATLLSWRRWSDPTETQRKLPLGIGGASADPVPLFDAVVRLGAIRRNNVWEYAGPQRLRVGETFSFVTQTYLIQGRITRVTERP